MVNNKTDMLKVRPLEKGEGAGHARKQGGQARRNTMPASSQAVPEDEFRGISPVIYVNDVTLFNNDVMIFSIITLTFTISKFKKILNFYYAHINNSYRHSCCWGDPLAGEPIHSHATNNKRNSECSYNHHTGDLAAESIRSARQLTKCKTIAAFPLK